MAGPSKGWISKKDPRRPRWEDLQGTSAGGSVNADSLPDPVILPDGTAAAPSSSGGSGGTLGGSGGTYRRPSAVEALQNVRAKYEKPGDRKEARKQRREKFTSHSSAFGIASVGKIAGQYRKMPASTKRAQRDWTVKDQNKRVNKEFNELVKGSVGVPYSRAYQKEARKRIRRQFPTVKSRAELAGETSRASWSEAKKAGFKAPNPWEGVKPGKETRSVARNLAGTPEMWPLELKADNMMRAKARKEAAAQENQTPLDRAGDLAESTGVAAAYRVGRSLSGANPVQDQIADKTGLSKLDKVAGANPNALPEWKDTVDAGLLALTFAGGVGAAGKLAKGEKLLEGSKAVEKALPVIRKATESEAWQIGKWAPRVAVTGYAASHPKETGAAVAGTAEAIWESPGKVAKSTGRAAISSLAFPFAVGANAIQSVKEKSTDPLEHMADDQIAELKRMADIYTSGDSEKIQKLTEDEMGAMGVIMAYYGLRPAFKGPIRAGARATSEALAARALKEGPEGGPATKLNNAIRAVEARRKLSQTKTATGRAAALESVIKEDVTSSEMGVRSGMNPSLADSPKTHSAKVRTQKKSDAWNKADLKGRKPGTEPVDIADAASFVATRGVLDSKDGAKVVMTDANLRRASRRIAPDAADQRTIAYLLHMKELRNPNDPMGKMFAAMVDEIRASGKKHTGKENPWIMDAEGKPRDPTQFADSMALETMAAGDQFFGKGFINRPSVKTERYLQAQEDALKVKEREVSGHQKRLDRAQKTREISQVKLSEMEIADRARQRGKKAEERTAAEYHRAATSYADARAWREEVDTEMKALRAERRDARQEGSIARVKELDKRLAELRPMKESARVEARVAQQKMRGTKKTHAATVSKVDPRLEPLRAKVAKLQDEEGVLGERLAKATEATEAYRREIHDTPTREEVAAAVGSAPKSGRQVTERIGEIDSRLDEARAELGALQDEGVSPQGQSMLQSEIAGLEGERTLLRLDNAANMDDAARSAAVAMLKHKKRSERVRKIEDQFRVEFNQKIQEYRDMGMIEGVYLRHRAPSHVETETGNPGYNSFLGSPKDKMRTGALARAGDVDRSYKALQDTYSAYARHVKHGNLTSWLTSNGVFKIADEHGNNRWQHTDRQLANIENDYMARHGRKLGDDYEYLDARLLDDPARYGSLVELGSLDKFRQGAVQAVKDMEVPGPQERLTQKIAAKGQGRKVVLVDKRVLKRMIDTEQRINSGAANKAWIYAMSIPSRLVLGTSPAWLFAQPIAEMSILLSDHPVRTFKAIYEHWKMSDPEEIRGLKMVAGNNLGTDLMHSTWGQRMVSKGVKGYRQTPMGHIIKDGATLKGLGKLDRAKGAWIREVGVLAELDRELSFFRRTSKAIMGQMDDIEKVAGKLSTMTRGEQIKWLNTKEGQAAGLRLARNIDASLGNWTDLTKAERILSAPIFFYPFVRFSLNWFFRTFPKRHPARYALLTSLGIANAEVIEKRFGEPNWSSDWAQVPIYDKDGNIVSSSSITRYTVGGNALVELGMGEGSLIQNLQKGLNPALQAAIQVAGGRDAYGGGLEGSGYGLEPPGDKARLLQGLDTILNLPMPVREARRYFGNRTPQPGDDPNKWRDAFRRDVFGSYPVPGYLTTQEYAADRAWQQYTDAQKTEVSEFSAKANRGEKVLKRESWWEQNRPGDYVNIPGRTEAEKDAVKQYIKEHGQNNYATNLQHEALRNLMEIYSKAGVPVPQTVKDGMAEWRQKARKAAHPGEIVMSNNKIKFIPSTDENPTAFERMDYLASVGKGPMNPSMPNREPSGPDYIHKNQPNAAFKNVKTTATIRATDTPDQMEEKISKAPTTYSRQQIARLQKLPRKQKVQFAKKILKAKSEFMASKRSGAPSGVPGKYKAAVEKWGTWLEGQMRKNGLVEKDDSFVGPGLPKSMSGPEYLAKIIQAESNWDAGASSAVASGLGQFTPGTRQALMDRTGTDAWSDKPEEQVRAVAELLSGSVPDFGGTMDHYNPGFPNSGDNPYGDGTWRYYFGQDVGKPTGTGRDGNQNLKQKWLGMVARGKAMGVYDVPEKPQTIDWSKAGPGRVRTAAKVIPVKKIDKWLKPSGSGSGQVENIHNLNPVLARQLIKVAEESGQPITVDSGQRSTEYQNNIDPGTNPKAPGGYSAHQFGMAADISVADAQAALMGKYGLEHGEAGAGVADPPHTELTDPKLIEEALRYGPIRSGYLPAGVSDSVGDITSWTGGGRATIAPMSIMQQLKAARKAKATAATSSSSSYSGGSSSSGGVSGQPSNGQSGNSWNNLQGWRGGIFGNLSLGGEGDDLTYPSPVESIVESGSVSLTKLPEYKKVKPNKAKR